MAAEEPGWKRVLKGGWHSNATDIEVDEAYITGQLAKRTTAKKQKDYKTADEIAKSLQEQGIAYVDEKMEWYTKAEKPAKVPAPAESGDKKRKRSDDAEAPVGGDGDGKDDDSDSSSDDEDDSEDEREDDVLVSKMRYAIVKTALDRQRAEGGSSSASSSSASASSSSAAAPEKKKKESAKEEEKKKKKKKKKSSK